jgi:hypothetical protein
MRRLFFAVASKAVEGFTAVPSWVFFPRAVRQIFGGVLRWLLSPRCHLSFGGIKAFVHADLVREYHYCGQTAGLSIRRGSAAFLRRKLLAWRKACTGPELVPAAQGVAGGRRGDAGNERDTVEHVT